MEPANDVSHTELSVTFQPPLFLERRGWVFEILRREGVHNVLDVGCGEGDLISCLCNPAPWLLAPPPSVLKSLVTSATVQREEIECSKLQAAVAHESYLHPTKVMGLDISATDLAYAIQGTAPRPQSTDSLSVSSIRWEPFEVEIWQGGLQSINPEFVDVECIVSTEVTLSSAWTTELESPVPEHPVMGDLEGVKSHWEDSSKDDMVFGDKISPQWPTSTLLPDNWGADEARSWGPAADWGEDVTIPAVDTDAVWTPEVHAKHCSSVIGAQRMTLIVGCACEVK
ncbi:hypothetical protein IEO21_05545 [Rhodonia placenta]|uniref:Small RNA 2'-O-methyltransferase n=1 Tax=Rhodonia placenta TaxID=104341 RepID=A0A8H7U256_9APHY|nr:hypothetical protein IEO21_05545 [Postia placenta]